MELKNPHPSRLAEGAELRNGLVLHPCVVDKNSGEISQEQGVPAPHHAPNPGFSARKINPHSFWLQKPEETESVEEVSQVSSSS